MTQWVHESRGGECFNEAAGFTQRKLVGQRLRSVLERLASMRPPVLPSGNIVTGICLTLGYIVLQ